MKRQLGNVVSGDTGKDAEIRQLKREWARVTEEPDILEMQARISPAIESEIRVHCRASSPVQGPNDVSGPAHPARWFPCLPEEPAGKVYGFRKLRDVLLNHDETCCPNCVARLTRLAGIRAQISYICRPGSYASMSTMAVNNTLDRHFDVASQDPA